MYRVSVGPFYKKNAQLLFFVSVITRRLHKREVEPIDTHKR